jgi:uncharacterized protein YndB with AHSA1/START domain
MPATTETSQFTINPGESVLSVTRLFDASPEKVFKAITTAELVEQWMGPRRYSTKVSELDAQRGGKWRFINSDGENEFGFNGVFHEVIPNERIVQTFEFEGAPGHVVLEQLTLTPEGDQTRLSVISAFHSVIDRDAMVGAGMQDGATESHDRLAELLETLDD